MNDGTRSTALTKPLNSPTAAPVTSPATRPIQMLLLRTITSAVTTPTRAITEPWDRSSSAATITTVMPKAAMARNEVCSRMFSRLRVVRNTSELKVM